MQSWRLALYESHNIACTQTRERDSSGTETVFEKTADERNVVDDCRTGQRAHFQQIPTVHLGTMLSRSRLACQFLFAGNHALIAQKADEMLEGSGIPPARSYASSAIS